jgi:tetratricopeptide (TPR) repeat protein
MRGNRRTIVLAVVLALVAADAFAQRGSVRGKLIGEDGQPIEGAECVIELDGGGRSWKAETKSDGQLLRGGLRPGTYTVTCAKEGYRKLALQTNVSAFDQANLGEHVFYRLAEGELSESEHARASELLEQFNLASESGDDASTLASLQELEGMMPESPEVKFNIAATHEKLGNEEEAIAYYDKVTELDATFYDAWISAGDLHGRRQEWAQAAEKTRKGLDIKMTDPIAIFNYGVFAQNAGDAEAAEFGFTKVLELDPNRALAHYQLGLIAVSKNENDTAIEHFEKFLELEPNHAQAEAAKGVIEALKQKSSGQN